MFYFRRGLTRLRFGRLLNGQRDYSRKSDSKNHGSYKIVNSNDVREDSRDARFETSPNWELFGPRGQRFLLPGSIGPAWHESCSMVPFNGFKKDQSVRGDDYFEMIECTAQDCPVLLKEAIKELFPGIDPSLESNQVTVVTLARRKSGSKLRDKDNEFHAKTFMWAAQEICVRLKMAGYWADFINPFSGRPYMSPYHKASLYQTDEKFRCIGFEVDKTGQTKVIRVAKDNQFVGSLFTNAPASTDFLMEILSEEQQ